MEDEYEWEGRRRKKEGGVLPLKDKREGLKYKWKGSKRRCVEWEARSGCAKGANRIVQKGKIG